MTTPPYNRPRLLLFRWARPGLPDFLSRHLDEHVQTLGHFFNVRVIDRDCDYGIECDEFEPALCVFESGVYAGERNIRNTGSRPEIPKLGFLHSDAYDLARAVFLSDMERWGVESFFTNSVAMAEYTPEISDRLFVWPHAVDPSVFRRYPTDSGPAGKNIPVLFTGSQERHYPWRNAVGRVLAQRFATMTMPHYGWGLGAGRTVHGTEYARLLSSSIFVPACGSMSRDLVRKHLEIPAAGACLVAEDTPALAAFGFVDMENCVLGEPGELADKLDFLLADTGRLAEIVQAGHDLVHTRHVQDRRSQVLEWLQLSARRGPGERIVQAGPAGSLLLAPAEPRPAAFLAGGRDREILAAGWRAVDAGDLDGARREFLKCLNFYFIPEAVIGLAFTELAAGNAQAARDWTTQALTDTFTDRSAPDPDPVLWATHLRALLCSGESGQALAAAGQFPALRHPELERMRRTLGLAAAGPAPARASICPPPARSEEQWEQELATHRQACSLAAPATPGKASARLMKQRIHHRIRWRLRTGPVKEVRLRLSPVKAKLLGDDWSRMITDLVRREGLDEAVLFGRPANDRFQRALRRGLDLNPSLPPLTQVPAAGPAMTGAATMGSLLPGTNGHRVLAFVADPAAAAGAAGFLTGCSLVIVNNTFGPEGYRLVTELTAGSRLVLLAHDALKGRMILGGTGSGSVVQQSLSRTRSQPVPQTGGRNE